MARPPKNNADYFGHDHDMRNHRKIKAIRGKFGIAGYAMWSMFLEVLTGSEENKFTDNELEIELLAGDFGVSVTEIRELIDYCIRLELLFSENGKIYSKTLDERLKSVYEKRNLAKKNYQKHVESKDNSTGEGVSVTEKTQSKVKVKDKVNIKEEEINKEDDADRVSGEDQNSESDLKEEKKENPPKVPPKGSREYDPAKEEMPFPTERFRETWLKWIKYRKEIKKKLTETMAQSQLAKLGTYSEGLAIEFIMQSIESGWTGLFFEIKTGRSQFARPSPEQQHVPGKIEASMISINAAADNIRRRRELEALS